MSEKLNENKIIQLLDWSYDKAVNGIPGMGTAEEMGDDYLKLDKSLDKQINSLIRMQDLKSATSGFITGLGGLITLPVAIPANLASVIYVQIRMIAAIAYMCGYDIRSDQVKTLVYACLAGNAVGDIAKDIGIDIGTKIATAQLKNMSAEGIKAINKKVGFKLLTKFGEKGSINLVKWIPVLGGIVGGTFDTISTHSIGKIAKKVFYK